MRVSVGKNTRPRASEPKKPLIGDPVTTYPKEIGSRPAGPDPLPGPFRPHVPSAKTRGGTIWRHSLATGSSPLGSPKPGARNLDARIGAPHHFT